MLERAVERDVEQRVVGNAEVEMGGVVGAPAAGNWRAAHSLTEASVFRLQAQQQMHPWPTVSIATWPSSCPYS
jgi:hypothetical protein